MTRKSDGSRRFCSDMRKVNAGTEPDAYPLPNMQDILRKLRKAKASDHRLHRSGIGTVPIPAHAIRPYQCAGYLPATH